MKLFRRKEPKTSHPHHGAMQHLQNAHQALMGSNAVEGMQHIGRALKAVQSGMPKGPALEPGSTPATQTRSTAAATVAKRPLSTPGGDPQKDDTGVANLNLGLKGLRGLKGK